MSLTVKSIHKKFGEKIIFNGFSYDFPDTGIFAINGKSGIGKTTLLRIISGLDTDYTGEILGGGKKNISFAFQEYRLFPNLSAIENIVYALGDKPSEIDFQRASEMLSNFRFTEDEMKLYPRELSGGMKQRVSLIRAILKDTPVLLLDEPTKELDSDIKAILYSTLVKEGNKRLVITVSHLTEDMNALNATVINI